MKPTEPPSSPHSAAADDTLHNPEVAHEHSDVNVSAIVTFGAGLATVVIVAFALMAVLFNVLEQQATSADPLMSPLSAPATQMAPTTTASPVFGQGPEPQLLTNEPTYLRQFRERMDQELHGYGWVDEKAGVARIPIEEAKKRLLERGLPARADETAPWLGTHAPARGESSSGRTVPRYAR